MIIKDLRCEPQRMYPSANSAAAYVHNFNDVCIDIHDTLHYCWRHLLWNRLRHKFTRHNECRYIKPCIRASLCSTKTTAMSGQTQLLFP